MAVRIISDSGSDCLPGEHTNLDVLPLSIEIAVHFRGNCSLSNLKGDMMAVRIISDSGSDCLPGEHTNLDVLPLSIAFGDTTYSADVDLTRERFYERIITDSGSDCLPGEHPNLDVLPLSIAFGDTTYSADVDLTRERFYELLVEGDEFPTTGQVNPFAFSQAISRAQEAGDDVVILALSSKLSGTHQSAATAASQADGSTEVHVVDTKSVTVGQHILVDYALRLVEEGRSAAEARQPRSPLLSRPPLTASVWSPCSTPSST